MIVFILVVITSLSVSTICSLMEACLLSISVSDIAQLSDKKPYVAKVWEILKGNIHKPIAVVLIINTFAHTIGASVSGAKFQELFGPHWVLLYSIIFSLVMIQWTEILPKTLGVRYNIKLANITGVPLHFLIIFMTPLVKLTEWLNRPFQGTKEMLGSQNAVEELSLLIRFAALKNQITRDQEKIFSRTINLHKLKVKDVMVEKSMMKCLTTVMSLTDAFVEAHLHHHTRFPFVDTGNNEVVGYINFKDVVTVLKINPREPSLKGICRPIISVLQDEILSALLNRLTQSHQHIAIVKNSQGETMGMVTLEDVIEAIIGEVHDEYDILPSYFYAIAENRYIAGGAVTLKSLREKLNLDVPGIQQTVSDWLIEYFGKLPKTDERRFYLNSQFIVRKIRRTGIYEIIIDVQPSSNEKVE